MSDLNFATECPQSLIEAVQSIAVIGKKVISVYSMDDLIKKFNTAITLPAAGVLYEGTRSVDASEQKGISCEIVCSILLLGENTRAVPGVESRDMSLVLLDTVRRKILGTKSPTGHFWKFVLEAPAATVKGQVVWLQRWRTPVQIISRPNPT